MCALFENHNLEVVVAHLVAWSLPTPENPGSNSAVKTLSMVINGKDKNKRKRGREWPI